MHHVTCSVVMTVVSVGRAENVENSYGKPCNGYGKWWVIVTGHSSGLFVQGIVVYSCRKCRIIPWRDEL